MNRIKHCHRTRLGVIVSTAEPLIRLPVHAFRFVWERFRHGRAPSQPDSNFLRFSGFAKVQSLALTCISQAIAAPAGEQLTRAVQHCNTESAVSTTGRAATDEPRAVAAEVARGPSDWDALLYALPISLGRGSRAVHQNHGVDFGAHVDAAKWLSAAAPGSGEG